MSKNHKPPVVCRVRRFFVSPSPSAMLCKCALGLHRRTRRCPGCEANTAETIVKAFLEGFQSGMTSIDEWKDAPSGKFYDQVMGGTAKKEKRARRLETSGLLLC